KNARCVVLLKSFMRRESRSKQQNFRKILKKLESEDQSQRSAAAIELVRELQTLYSTKERIAFVLGISAPTVHRWAKGEFAPRHLSRIKALLNNPGSVNQLQLPAGWLLPSLGEGIRTMDFFFEMAAFAKNVFKFKSLLEFQVGDSEQLQRRTKNLL